MKTKGKRMISLALAGFLCWSVPMQPLTAETLQEDPYHMAADNTVTGSDAEANEMEILLSENNREEIVESADVSSMLYQAGGFGTPVQEDNGIAVYAMISPEEQENLKRDILQALEAETESLDISNYNIPVENKQELLNLFSQVVNENPKLFYVTGALRYANNGTIYTRLTFTYAEVTDEQKAAFSAKLNEAVSLVTSAMSEEEKALVLHDYLAQHCAYAYDELESDSLSSGSPEYNAYGALVNGKAVCQGYSEAYQALLQEVGIRSYICSSNAMNHAWNVVLIDGAWYHVDVTWDDPVRNREGRALHTFFLLSDTEMENRKSGGNQYHHDWTDNVDCNSDKYDSASYWWSNVDSQIVQVGHQDYIYVKEASATTFEIVRKTDSAAERTLYTGNAEWTTGENYWPAQAFLSRQGDYIYFNDDLKIYSMSLAGGNVQEVYTYEKGDGLIYGAMVYEDGTARLNIDTTPNRDTDSYISVQIREIISVTGVTLSQSSASLKEGETLKLTATVVPDNADNRTVTWSSDDPDVASVAENGVVTAGKSGTAVIRVTTADGGKTASCTVTVICSHVMTETAAKEPTCAAEGNIQYWTCSKCDKYFSDAAGTTEITEKDIVRPVSAEHGATEVRNAKDAEAGREGYTGDTYCTVCDTMIKKGEVIPALPHTHSMTKVDAVNPTCGTPGNVAYWTCGICEKNFIDEEGETEAIEIVTPPTGNHRNTVTQNYRPATEESEGYSGDIYCNDCHQVIGEGKTIPKLPHTHVMSRTAAVAAACETDGNVEYWTCSKCGKKYADQTGAQELTDVVIRAAGHTPGAWNSDETSHWKICTACGKEIVRADHSFRWIVDKAATENETGLSHEECDCGAQRSENTVIPKLDHVHTGIQHHDAVAASCITKGRVEYWTCSGAGCAGKYYADSTCQITIASVEIPVNANNHTGTGYWSKDAEKHVFTCDCGVVTISGAHVYGGDTDSDCDQCGYKRFYVVTGGANAAYATGSENGLTIIADGEFKLFQEVAVDGRTVDKVNYEVREGSTVVTLKKAYLDTLSSGVHDIRVLYTDGKVALTRFTIQEKADTGNIDTDNADTDDGDAASADTQKAISPKTGESYQSIYWEAVMAVCAAAVTGILICRKRSYGKVK